MNIWVCEICGFEYDEAKGLPGDGIPPGTRWEDIPEDWLCPECGATKSDFRMKKCTRGRGDALSLGILNP